MNCAKCKKEITGTMKVLNKDGKTCFVLLCLGCWRKWIHIWSEQKHPLGNDYWKTKIETVDEFCNNDRVRVIYT